MPQIHQGNWTAQGKRFAILASRWNEFVADKLIDGAVDALGKTGARDEDIEIYRCPGAFELPGLARRVADSGAYDAIVCLGVVIRGATPHFDVVVNQATRGIAQIAAEAKLAVGFGVLTCDTIEQAIERAGSKGGNRGSDAAMAAIEMSNLYDKLDDLHGNPERVPKPSRDGTRRAELAGSPRGADAASSQTRRRK